MDFYRSKLKLPLCVIAAGAMVFSAGAQPAGRSIIFSTLQTNNASAMPSLAPQASDQPNFPDQPPAPGKSLFAPENSPEPLPQPPMLSPAGQERMRQLQADQKNWALMSPEEIFGVAPLETDADGKEKNQSQLERFLDRQNRLQGGATNGGPAEGQDAPWNFSRDRNGRPDANWFSPAQNGAENVNPDLRRFLNGEPDGKTSANQNNNSRWNAFNPPQPQPVAKPDLAQLAAMERFRQLLEPSPATDTAATQSADGGFFPAPKIAVDPNITQPMFAPNPAGVSFTPPANGISRPTGLTPLPGIVTPASQQPTAAPSWAPQQPPWFSQGPQPFTIPQRKF
jgi:hypothetical protein